MVDLNPQRAMTNVNLFSENINYTKQDSDKIKEIVPKKVKKIDEIQKNIDKLLLILKRYQKIQKSSTTQPYHQKYLFYLQKY